MPINPLFLARLVANDPSVTSMEERPGTWITLDEIKELVEAAKNNTYLKTIILVDQNIDDDMAIALSALQNIEVLTLDSNKITDASVNALGKMPKLQELYLGSNRITDTGAKVLASLKLTVLELFGNDLTSACKDCFLANKTITSLSLSYNKIDESTLTEIQQHIANNKRVADKSTNDSRAASLAIESRSSLFQKNSNESKEQVTEVTSPTEQGKIKLSIISQSNSLPEDIRKKLIEDLLNSLPVNAKKEVMESLIREYNLNIKPSSPQTLVK